MIAYSWGRVAHDMSQCQRRANVRALLCIAGVFAVAIVEAVAR
jgi:hypothetical protein